MPVVSSIMLSTDELAELGRLSTAELLDRAAERRDLAFGDRMTFSPKVFIPVTKLCADRCGYCTFAQPPARVEAPFMDLDAIVAVAVAGAAAGCHEALLTLGERPELRYPAARQWLDAHGYESTIHYLQHVAEVIATETGLLPHANAGALFFDELAALRRVSPSQGMMLESINDDLAAHRSSPDKVVSRRIATLRAAGELQIPFTTGILVGIGEGEADRIGALAEIAQVARDFGHIQEVIVQNFMPKPGTAMAKSEPCPQDDYLRAIALARLVLPASVHIQAPPNLSEDFGALIEAGVDDWGGVSPITVDHVNPERPWPHLDTLAAVTESHGKVLAPRLTIHPEWAANLDRWVDSGMHQAVRDRADAEWLGRDDPGSVFPEKTTPSGERRESTAWCSGSAVRPPQLVSAAAPDRAPMSRAGHRRSAVDEVIEGVRLGQTVDLHEIVTLFSARGPEVERVCELADELRAEAVGDAVTWVSNRNINYTNVCTFKCKFCGFSKGPLSLNLRGNPYLLTLDQLAERVVEAAELGATEVTLQGGIHPSFDGDYYLDVCRAVKAAVPDMHVHGFTALEVTEGAKRLGEDLESYLRRLMDAGLRSLPGTAAEILSDDIREILCNDKVTTDEWIECHRIAHRVGLRSNITIMFGSVEQPVHWAKHILVTRDLQRETGGFTEFIPLPFVHMAAPIYLQGGSRRGPTFREVLLMHAVGRIAYRGLIDNVQASWVKLGFDGVEQALRSGVNDLGGTLMDENISRAAGAEHGQGASQADFEALVGRVGRRLEQRTTLYGRVLAPA